MSGALFKDENSFLDDLSANDFYSLMIREPVFIDYFNKYCFLPIFGEKVAYSIRRGRFIFDPPLRGKNGTSSVSNDIVCDWLYGTRLKSFSASKISNECKLCMLIMKSPVYYAIVRGQLIDENDAENSISDAGEAIKSRLGSVSKIAKFRQFVADSKYSKHLISFWMDAEQLRKVRHEEDRDSESGNKGMSAMLLRAIQNKYFRTTSRFFLTLKALGDEISIGSGNDCRMHNFENTMRLQVLVLEILRDYWVPKYIIHTMRRKPAVEKTVSFEGYDKIDLIDEDQVMKYKLRRCSMMVRRIVNPNHLKSDAIQFNYDEDEGNVLLKDEERQEEWSETSTELGRADVEYIHDHFFSDKEKQEVRYRTTQVSNDIESSSSSSSFNSLQRFDSQMKSSSHSLINEMEPKLPRVLEKQESRLSLSDSSSCGYDADKSSEEDFVDGVTSSRLNGRPSSATKIKRRRKSKVVPATIKSSSSSFLPPISETSSSEAFGTKISSNAMSLERNTSKEEINIVTPVDISRPSISSFYTSLSLPRQFGASPDDDFDLEEKNDMKWSLRGNTESILSEILMSDELSGFLYRHFLISQPPDSILNLSAEDSAKSDIEKLSHLLDFWRDIEHYRRQYASLPAAELTKEQNMLLRQYFYDDHLEKYANIADLRKIWLQPSKKRSSSFITRRFIEIQSQLQKQPMVWKMGKRRHSFPYCVEEYRRLPILRVEMGDPNHKLGIKDSLVFEGNDEELLINFLGKEQSKRMKYRTSRAVYLLMMCVQSSPGGDDLTYGYYKNEYDKSYCAEICSDSDGSITEFPQKRFVRLPDLDTKALARMSAPEYPRPDIDYSKFKAIRVVDRHRLIKKPMYLRPITKGGVSIRRPTKRPKNLMEVLREPVHFMFLKRFMRAHNSEAPLLFWKSVDLLKRTEDISTRQRKAKGVMKKFFSRVAGGGILLQCDEELIKELGKVENVTTSMLAEAQTLVYKSMEKNWGARYLRTFPNDGSDDSEEEQPPYNLRETRLWRVFQDFIRRIVNFIKQMRIPSVFEQFRRFLKNLPDQLEMRDGRIKQLQTAIITGHGFETEQKITPYSIFGRIIALNFVHNDFLLWIEINRFVALVDNMENLMLRGSLEQGDYDLVRSKAQFIIDCFFDSKVLPRLRVNVHQEMGEKISETVGSGDFKRGLFHRIVSDSFPVILHFWSKFCELKYVYKSRRTLRAERQEEAKMRRRKLMHLRKKFLGQQVSVEEQRKSKTKIPNYMNEVPLKSPLYEKVKGIVVGDPPILHFSLQHGLKLIIPPQRTKQVHSGDAQLLKVWTRDAKAVNVLAVGSDPKLFDLDRKRQQPFNVLCDLIE